MQFGVKLRLFDKLTAEYRVRKLKVAKRVLIHNHLMHTRHCLYLMTEWLFISSSFIRWYFVVGAPALVVLIKVHFHSAFYSGHGIF